MPKVFEVVQYLTHPITKEKLFSEENIDQLLAHKTIKECAYILHDEDQFNDEDELEDRKKCENDYNKLTLVEGHPTLEEYLEEHHWKRSGALKPPHYHVVFRTERNMDYDTIAGWMSIRAEYVEGPHYRRGEKDGKITFADKIRYLTHESEKEQAKGKHRYPDDKVIANFDWRKMLDDIDMKLAKYGNKSEKDFFRHQVLYEGMSIHQVILDNRDAYAKDMTFLDKARAKYLAEFAEMPLFRVNIYLDGKGGIGKNTACKALARNLFPEIDSEDLYFEVGGENTSFEGYDGQPVIIWNDFRAVDLVMRFGRGELFDMFDSHPTNARHNIKYGSVRLVNPINIINGIEPYDVFLDSLSGEYKDKHGNKRTSEDKSQAYRRFPIIMCLRETDYDALFNKGVFENTREYMQYIGYRNITGSFARVAQQLEGKAKEKIMMQMCTPITDKIKELQESEATKISDVESIPEEFNAFGTNSPWGIFL